MQRLTVVIFLGWLISSGAAPPEIRKGKLRKGRLHLKARSNWAPSMKDFTGRHMDYRIKALSGVEIIDSYNYPVQVHTVRTNDGYRLDVFRIPSSRLCSSKKPKPVVFINHGMTASADAFLLTGPKHGLPFRLADSCYDVWLGNARGTRYSRRHVALSAYANAFWHFGWHEIGLVDLSAVLKYIMAYTKQKAVHFVGHSQGCTTLLVLLSLRPEFNKHIKTVHFLAPAVFMRHSDFLAMNLLEPFIMAMPDCEFGPHLGSVNLILGAICELEVINEICTSLYMLANGQFSQHTNRSIIPLLVATQPAGVSSRQPKHFLQLRESGKFRQFDYGYRKNKILYNRSTPPDYPLKRVRPLSPIHIYYSDWDPAANSKDVLELINVLPNVVKHRINRETWNHCDFLYAYTADKMVNKPIMSVIQRFERGRRRRSRNP